MVLVGEMTSCGVHAKSQQMNHSVDPRDQGPGQVISNGK